MFKNETITKTNTARQGKKYSTRKESHQAKLETLRRREIRKFKKSTQFQ